MTKSTKSPSLRWLTLESVFDLFLEIGKTRFVPRSYSSKFLQKSRRQILKVHQKKKQAEKHEKQTFIDIISTIFPVSLSLPYVSLGESVREDFREKGQTVGVKQSGTSFCHLGNRAVTDSRNETWKILKAFWYFHPTRGYNVSQEKYVRERERIGHEST